MTAKVPGLVIHGGGRMGRQVFDAAGDAGFSTLAVVSPHPPSWVSESTWSGELSGLDVSPGVVIDFSLPEGTLTVAKWCAANGTSLVSGTTGVMEIHIEALEQAARLVPVLWSANFSIGINVCLDLVSRASGVLGELAGIEITDIHHEYKLDAPSGTALCLGDAANAQNVEYTSLREGEEIGQHFVRFSLQGEEVEIVHRARDRGIYARGALNAAQWLLGQPPGFYTAADWLA